MSLRISKTPRDLKQGGSLDVSYVITVSDL
jgi:hypothetical protein